MPDFETFKSAANGGMSDVADSDGLLSNIPFDNRDGSRRSSAPEAEQHESMAELTFLDVFSKFDYNKDAGLSKAEVQRASSDKSLDPHERKMAQLLTDNFKTIRPMGSSFFIDSDKLERPDLRALDTLGKKGITGSLSFNYSNSVSGEYLMKGLGVMYGASYVAKLIPHPVGKLAVAGGGFVIGSAYGFYGVGKGVIDYYKAKPELNRISGEVRNLSGRSS